MVKESKFSLQDVTKTVLDYTFSLSSLKVIKSMSEETLCFEGILNLNGKAFCIVSNRGEGGPDSHVPLKGKQNYNEIHTEIHRIDADLRERGPKTKYLGVEITTDFETVTGALIEDILFAKKIYAMMNKKVVLFDQSTGKIASIALTNSSKESLDNLVGTPEKALSFQEKYNQKHGERIIVLNSLSKEEVLGYLRKNGQIEDGEEAEPEDSISPH